MSERRSDRKLTRYFCTAGNGMEAFLTAEVKRKLAAEDVCQMPGKVLFSASAGINEVCELKSAERLFLLLKQDSPVRLSAHTRPAKAASVLQSRLLGDGNQWTSAVTTWSRLQGELIDRRTAVNKTSALRVTTEREEEEKCDVESGKSAGEQTEESGDGRQKSGKQSGAVEKKRKREEEEERDVERKREEETSGETCSEAQTLEKKRKRDNEEEEEEKRSASQDLSGEDIVEKQKTIKREGEERGTVMELSSCRNPGNHGLVSGTDVNQRHTPPRDHSVGTKDKRMDGTAEDAASESAENVSFRISCKCTGSLSRYFSTQEVSKVIGVGLSRLLGWKANLKNPQMEVNVFLSDDHCLLGIPLTRLPLANRTYIKTTGLRSTVAWAMASLAQIQPGFCVVDPMCGVGTILIEAAQEHKDLQAIRFLGVDVDDGQLQKASDNVEFAKLGNRIHLLKASSMALPLPSASVEAVVCDLPFGRKFGTKTDVAANLPLILTEMERVLCVGGTLVLLLSPQLSGLLKKLLAQKDTGPASNQETKPQTGTQHCPSPSLSSAKQQTFQIQQGVKSPTLQETDPKSGLRQSLPPPLASLKHQTTLRVSLGVIDGLIHKYVKTDHA